MNTKDNGFDEWFNDLYPLGTDDVIERQMRESWQAAINSLEGEKLYEITPIWVAPQPPQEDRVRELDIKELSSFVLTALDENGLVDPAWVDAESVASKIAQRIVHYSIAAMKEPNTLEGGE